MSIYRHSRANDWIPPKISAREDVGKLADDIDRPWFAENNVRVCSQRRNTVPKHATRLMSGLRPKRTEKKQKKVIEKHFLHVCITVPYYYD
jgi:hypothetical protein